MQRRLTGYLAIALACTVAVPLAGQKMTETGNGRRRQPPREGASGRWTAPRSRSSTAGRFSRDVRRRR